MLLIIRSSILLVAALLALSSAAGTAQEIEPDNIPDTVQHAIASGRFEQSYVIDGSMNPFYLRGDFDGDGKPDYALWIKSKAHGDIGIAIWLSLVKRLVIVGAGTSFIVSGITVTNLNFLNTWQVYGKATVERGVESGKPPRLKGDAIQVGKRESASGLIYWTGKSFSWYQQGD